LTGDYTLQTMDFQRGYHFLSSNDNTRPVTWLHRTKHSYRRILWRIRTVQHYASI